MTPLVSVIIPVHNGAPFLREALESVFAQTHRPLEVIVADDASTDDSASIAESFPGVDCLRLPKVGVSAARNRAVERSTGDWLAFLDADDRWFPSKLGTQLSAGEADPAAGLVLARQTFRFECDPPGWFRGPTDGSPATGFEPSAWLVRRDVFEIVGPFDEGRSLGEDTDWFARAIDAGVRYIVPEPILLERRIHPWNATSRIEDPRGHVLGLLRGSLRRKAANGGANV